MYVANKVIQKQIMKKINNIKKPEADRYKYNIEMLRKNIYYYCIELKTMLQNKNFSLCNNVFKGSLKLRVQVGTCVTAPYIES